MSDFDILSPEFFEMAAQAKKIAEEKQKKVEDFKELWVKHKAEVAALDAEAASLKEKFLKATEMTSVKETERPAKGAK